MIDRIENNNYYNTYSNVGRKKINTGDFSNTLNTELPSKQNGDVDDDKGVKLDLHQSTATQTVEEPFKSRYASSENKEVTNTITFQQIKDTISSFVTLLKDTWKTIWEDNPDTKDLSQEMESKDLQQSDPDEQLTVEPYGKDGSYSTGQTSDVANKDVEKVLRSKNIDQLTAMVTNNGKLKLAKNSQLLTTYNRQGRIVQLDGTQKERILHGDKNLMKS